MASVIKTSILLLTFSSLFALNESAGGPTARRKAKADALDINFGDVIADQSSSRDGRNLANVFPFVGGDRADQGLRPLPHSRGQHDEQHHAHHEHHEEDDFDQSRFARQRRPRPQQNRRPGFGGGSDFNSQQGSGADLDLDIGTIAAAGERCIDKVVMVEETEYDDHIECHHSYSERCHTTYTTDFEPQQEEECDETYKKSCYIDYKKVASDEPIRFCHTPLVCEGEGPEECKTVYESECETRYHEHEVDDDVVTCETINEEKCEDVTQGYTTEQKCTKWPRQVCDTQRQRVKKFTPETECKKVPRQLCGPSGCVPQPGPEECFDKKETVIQEVPEETCNLEPQRQCKHVTKLVPLLKPQEECVDIPKEVCSRSRRNPRKVQKPVIKKWCYVPTRQSGLL